MNIKEKTDAHILMVRSNEPHLREDTQIVDFALAVTAIVQCMPEIYKIVKREIQHQEDKQDE